MTKLENLHRHLVEDGPKGTLEGGLFLVLRLFSMLYGVAIRLRNLSFSLGLRKSYRSSLPVIAVGNLAVGGTGKTPMVDLLIRYGQSRGARVAVVSRGYGGSSATEVGIVSLGKGLLMSAAEAGDEPLLLARRNPEACVLVAPRRRKALEYIESHACADLIILDDGFQHRQVARDLDLLLLDVRKPFGNGQLLPAGLLREQALALKRADLICLTGHHGDSAPCGQLPGALRVTSRLADTAHALTGEVVALDEIARLPIVAFAGIARPERFFVALEEKGLTLQSKLALGDHARYDASQIKSINAAAENAAILLTTEKDAVKLATVDLIRPCYSIGLEVEIDDEGPLVERLNALLNKGKTMSLSKELLDILACPKCKGPVELQQNDETQTIACSVCQVGYPVRDGIPVMLIDEAAPLKG